MTQSEPVPKPLASSKQSKIMILGGGQLLTFARWPGTVEATNTNCERDLRIAVFQREVTNGNRATCAAEDDTGVWTVADTARLKPGDHTFGTILQTIGA